MQIRPASLDDAAAFAALYNPFVLNTTITYELEAVSTEAMAARILARQAAHAWLTLADGETILGYGYYGSFRERAAYRHVVESSLYLAPAAHGRGLGRALYEALIAHAQAQGYREMIGVIALPNPRSICLHEALGFEQVGLLARSGYKFGQYLDTALWQKALTPSTQARD